MEKIALPIIILVENSYLDIYATVDDAELNLEAIDVADNLYKGFDAEGRLLNIQPCGNQAKITLAEEVPTHQAELCALLKEDLKTREEINSDDLNSLIKLAEKHTKYIPRDSRNLLKIIKDAIIYSWGVLIGKR